MYEQASFCMNGQFEIGAISATRYFLCIALVLGVLFASVSEIDSGSSLLLHLLTWQLQTVIPMSLFVGSHLALSKSSQFADLNPWLRLFFSGVLGVFVFTPLNLGLDIMLQRDELGDVSTFSAMLSEMRSMGPPAIISWLAINAPWVQGFRIEAIKLDTPLRSGNPKPDIKEVSQELSRVRFLSLISESRRGELIYLKADLHYISVITTAAQSLILYNLKDAINEIPSELGFQCHRSYWVNKQHIMGLEKKGRQGILKLSDGNEVPVSRSYLAQARQYLPLERT